MMRRSDPPFQFRPGYSPPHFMWTLEGTPANAPFQAIDIPNSQSQVQSSQATRPSVQNAIWWRPPSPNNPAIAQPPKRLGWRHGTRPLRLERRFVGSSILALPIELLDLIFEYLLVQEDRNSTFELWQNQFRKYGSVCKLWQGRLMGISPEPSTTQGKLNYLRRFKVFQRRWFTVKYGYSDTNHIPLHTLVSDIVPYQTISHLSLAYPVAKGERLPLLELAHLETIKQLELDGWDESMVIEFLDNRQSSSLVSVKLRRLHTPLSKIAAKQDLRCQNVEQLHVEFGSKLFMTSLINFGVQTAHQMYLRPLTPTPPFSNQQQQELRTLVIRYEEDSPFDIQEVVFSEPLRLSNSQNLLRLEIDGGHENSNILPKDFFLQLQSAVQLDTLELYFCCFDSKEFFDFTQRFFYNGLGRKNRV
ncbi:hypothetical protein BT69DRAFT_1349073 [Atractiella rhizophila]|nr:hypothetical protein BT69DRAFT_1349073 [Atractiella rhizophila]